MMGELPSRMTTDVRIELQRFVKTRENSRSELSEGGSSLEPMRIREETPEDAVEHQLPDVSYLKPRARAFYHRTLGEWYDKWTSETVAAAVRAWTAYFRAESTLYSKGAGRPQLTEEEQMMVLEGMKPEIEDVFGRPGGGRR